jgi:hypothetical protein
VQGEIQEVELAVRRALKLSSSHQPELNPDMDVARREAHSIAENAGVPLVLEPGREIFKLGFILRSLGK